MSNNNTPSSADDALKALHELSTAVRFASHGIKPTDDEAAEFKLALVAIRAFISGASDNQPQGELNATRLDTNDRATAGDRRARSDLQHIARDGREPGSSGVASHPLRGGDGMVVGDITPSTRPGCAGVHLPLDASAASAPLGWLYDWTHSSALGKPDEHFTGFTTDETYARKHDNPRPVWGAPDAANAGEPAPDYVAWGLCSRLNASLEAIGDYAHEHSTGPAVPDALWEVRRMAYDAMEDVAEPCPQGDQKTEPSCTNRHQCWEPCGDLGKSAEHARVSGVAADPSAKALHLLHEMACRFHDTNHDDGICERAMAFLRTLPEPTGVAADESTRAPDEREAARQLRKAMGVSQDFDDWPLATLMTKAAEHIQRASGERPSAPAPVCAHGDYKLCDECRPLGKCSDFEPAPEGEKR